MEEGGSIGEGVGIMNSFGHDFAHALIARDTADEYRQIERLYGPRDRSWQFVRQALSMGPGGSGRRYDVITIRMTPRVSNTDPVTRDIYFDITSFMGGPNAWPDHAAGRILPGAEMQAADITGAGQAAGSTTSYGPTLAFIGFAGLVAVGLGLMAESGSIYRTTTRGRDCSGWDPKTRGGWDQCDPKTIPKGARRRNPCGCQH